MGQRGLLHHTVKAGDRSVPELVNSMGEQQRDLVLEAFLSWFPDAAANPSLTVLETKPQAATG